MNKYGIWGIRRVKGLVSLNVIEYLGLGIYHERCSLPCQDAIGNTKAKNGNMIMALSDGAGSARFAKQAAWENVYAVLEYFEAVPLSVFLSLEEEQKKKDILDACRNRLCQFGGKEYRDYPLEFSATLLFYVYDGKHFVTGQLGDGAMFIFDRYCKCLFCSESVSMNGEKWQVYFTSSSEADSFMQIHVFDVEKMPVDKVLMASDGACLMFENRGGGMAAETAKEIVQFVRKGEIRSNTELADVLNQMAEVSSERLDDWSVLVWSGSTEFKKEKLRMISMLKEENEKYTKIGKEGMGRHDEG